MRISKLKLLRYQRSILQIEVATRAGIDRARLSLIECGHVQPRPDEIERIARALNVAAEVVREAAA